MARLTSKEVMNTFVQTNDCKAYTVTVGTSAVSLERASSASIGRTRFLTIYPEADIYLGDSAVTTSTGIKASANTVFGYQYALAPQQKLYAIAGTAGQTVRVLDTYCD